MTTPNRRNERTANPVGRRERDPDRNRTSGDRGPGSRLDWERDRNAGAHDDVETTETAANSAYGESEPYEPRQSYDRDRGGFGSRDYHRPSRMNQGGHERPPPWWRFLRHREFSGKGPRDDRRSDERIREDVCDDLTYAPDVDASDVVVAVSEGEVTLSGEVEDRFTKRRTEEIAEEVSGVRNVHNRLRSRRGLVSSMVHEMTRGSEDERNIGRGPSQAR